MMWEYTCKINQPFGFVMCFIPLVSK